MEEQDIHGFMLSMQHELKDFIENWEEKNLENPTDWPMEMSEEDWLDQFITWLQM